MLVILVLRGENDMNADKRRQINRCFNIQIQRQHIGRDTIIGICNIGTRRHQMSIVPIQILTKKIILKSNDIAIRHAICFRIQVYFHDAWRQHLRRWLINGGQEHSKLTHNCIGCRIVDRGNSNGLLRQG